MTQPAKIDFYCLQSDAPLALEKMLVKLCQKIISRGYRIYCHCQDDSQAQRLDEYLWTYDDTSFLSHTRLADIADKVKITLGSQQPLCAKDKREVLICLSEDIPEFYNDFQRVCHLVPADDNAKAQLRAHYKHYQTQGHTVDVHQLS